MRASVSPDFARSYKEWSGRELGLDFQPSDVIDVLIRRGVIRCDGNRYKMVE